MAAAVRRFPSRPRAELMVSGHRPPAAVLAFLWEECGVIGMGMP